MPDLPISTFEAPQPWLLWEALEQQCLDAGTGCDAIAVPHNANLSNGRLYDPSWMSDAGGSEAVDLERRVRLEPAVEIFQHKGDSECRNGFGDPDDPQCAFEKLRPDDDTICDDSEVGAGGMRGWGCVSRLNFVRNTLKQGLIEGERTGVNPYRLAFFASTDTHNGTPGAVSSAGYQGHIGIVDDTVEERLGHGNLTHDGILDNPGGLTGVWAVENSRDALFEAFRRRETFGTSGPRMSVRVFGGWSLPDTLCTDDDPLKMAYRRGVPMGGILPKQRGDGAPGFWIQAEGDVLGLDRIQVIKGWLDAAGEVHEQVYDVTTGSAGTLDEATCDAGGGSPALCTWWEDPDFDPAGPAFWYVRVLEVPTCRWSAMQCLLFDAADRPEHCDDGLVQSVVQHRAWTSPIWFEP